MFQSMAYIIRRVRGGNMDDKKTVAVHVVLASLLALGLIMTSVTMLRTLGAI